MWLKVVPDIELNLEVDLQGIDENTRDEDVQLFEDRVREALIERLKKGFAEEDISVHAMDVGVAREKYVKFEAA